MEIYFVFAAILALANAQGTQITDDNSRMGYGFFLPDHDLLGRFTGGSKIFQDFENSNCVVSVDAHKHSRDTSFYSDTSSFFSSISTKTGISGSLKGKYTMGATFNSKSTSIASENYEATGSSLFMKAHVKDEVFSTECRNSLTLDSPLVKAFELLPDEVDSPHYRSSWTEYESFLKTYGSHFISRTSFGAHIEQYNFAKSSKKYSQTQFEARVCADFLGPTKYGELNVTACFGMDYNSIKASTKLDMSSQFTVLGGTHEARTALLLDRSSPNIVKFLDSASDKSAIGYRFSGLWDLLQSRYVGTEHYAKALNLEYFYKGFLDTGCGFLKDSRSKKVLRQFVRAEDYIKRRPSYRCEIPPRGCNANSDCHLGGGGTWAVCYCYGDSCIDHKTKKVANRQITEAFTKFDYDWESHWVGTHYSCDYQIGIYCTCNKSWGGGWKALWASENVVSLKK